MLNQENSVRSVFSPEPRYGDKPKMIKYQIKKGHAGLGGRIFRVDEEIKQIDTDQDFISVKQISAQNYSSPMSQISQNQRMSRMKSVSSLNKMSPNNLFQNDVKRSGSPSNAFTFADLTQIKRLKLKKNISDRVVIEPSTQTNQDEVLYKRTEIDQEQCNEFKTDFVDQIPISDPIWRTVLPEDMFDNPNINLQKIISDNFEYFQHQLCVCACFRCSCGQCRCDFAKSKLNLGINHATVYGKDFQFKQNLFNQMNPLNATNYDTNFNEKNQIDLQSSQRCSYRPFQIKQQEKIQQQQQTKSPDFSGITSYKSTYTNWGDTQPIHFKRPTHISTSNNVPFYGQTFYQNKFCSGEIGQPAQLAKPSSLLTPLPIGANYHTSKLSQSQSTFQQFKLQPANPPQPEKQYQQIPAFQGQYQSQSSKDYTGQMNKQCPAKEYKKVLNQKMRIKQQ